MVVITDIGSGLNARRKGLQRLIGQAQERRMVEVVVTYRDRLSRFGVASLAALFLTCSVRLTVVQAAAEETSPAQELRADLLTLVASLSGRLYGRRSQEQREIVACVKTTVKSRS